MHDVTPPERNEDGGAAAGRTEAKLPAEALANLPDVPLQAVAICCDLDRHVFNAEHTDPKVAAALRETHWFDLREWTTTGPGSR